MAWYLLIAPAVVTVCSLIGWIAWLRFCRWLYAQTKDPAAFKHAATVAQAYRRPSVAETARRAGTAVQRRAPRRKDETAPPVP